MKTKSAFVFQRGKAWYVGWREPSGKQCRQSFGSETGAKTKAKLFAGKKTGELLETISDGYSAKTWDTFVSEYTDRILATKRKSTRVVYANALAHYKRICKPTKTTDITTAAVDLYIATRSKESGKTGSPVSPATINKELRALRALANIALDWKYLKDKPKFRWASEPESDPTFVSQADFEAFYASCDAATRPVLPNIDTADWWRAFLLFASMTGWRVSEILALLREDLDLKDGIAITRAADNKGKRTVRVPLHPMIVEHLEALNGFSPEVFAWPHEETAIYDQLHLIQTKAGVAKKCTKDHTHNDSCKWFGFHDFRRGFASLNAGSLSASELQTLMRHQNYTTTQKYIAMGAQNRDSVVAKLSVPNLKRGAS